MLETPNERAELLKKGIAGKKIEELYIINNKFKIIGFPLIIGIMKSGQY
jgi:hypothetical protein